MLFTGLLTACSSYNSSRTSQENDQNDASISGSFALKQQVAPPAHIQSIELHPHNAKAAPPIINLNGARQQLTLEFDDLDTGSRQFKLSISHREQDWDESPIAPNRYLSGFFETHFTGGVKSFVQNPSYFHYSYTFPNDQVQITQSGNYLLSVTDNRTNKVLFRIPFFVTENRGQIHTKIESLFAQRRDGRTLAQPFSSYTYPGFVTQPQFNLSFTYVQDRFWGRAKQTKFFDTASQGEVHFHLGRDQSFIGDYEFYVLNARSFQPDGRQIIDLQPGKTPPVVTLHRDLQQFKRTAAHFTGAVSGLPRNNQQAAYGNLIFTLETNNTVSPADEIYLVGDFNNWMIHPDYRMQYDSTRQQWKGQALIKQGIYGYKYVRVGKNGIDDLAIDQKFTDSRQEYLAFVYFRDPQYHFDRLLKVDRLVSK